MIKDALEAVQNILREAGLQHLAAQVPVKAHGNAQEVRGRIQIIDGLLRLRPPPKPVLDRLAPSWEALLKDLDGR
jgi:hypothetical protein